MISLAFQFHNSTILQTSTCDTTISALLVLDDAQAYSTGPNQYYSGFVIGGVSTTTLLAEGIWCKLNIDVADYTHSKWQCRGIDINGNTMSYTPRGPITSVGSGVSSAPSGGPLGKNLISTIGVVSTKHADTQFLWNTTVQKGKSIVGYTVKGTGTPMDSYLMQDQQTWMYANGDNLENRLINGTYGISTVGSEVCMEGFSSFYTNTGSNA